MPGTKVTFDVIRRIGRTLADVEESTMYGTPALKVRGNLMTCMAINKSAEPGSLGICMDFEQRAALLAEAPETYYVTDHYVKYPFVLVRLSMIREDQARDLLTTAWRFVSSQKAKTSGKKPWKPRRS